jgi:hypothetical protein
MEAEQKLYWRKCNTEYSLLRALLWNVMWLTENKAVSTYIVEGA